MKVGFPPFFTSLDNIVIVLNFLQLSLLLGPPQFFLAGNPLLCDCHLQWFYQMASAQLQHYAMIPSMNQLYPEVPDLDLIQCRLLNVSRPSVPAVVDLTHLQEQDFLCPYQTHCLALCLCCEYLACDCQVRLLFFPQRRFSELSFMHSDLHLR